MIRVLVAAAYPTARAGLAAVLRAAGGVEVIGEATGADDLLAQVAALAPDVVLLELETGQEELAGTAWQLAAASQSSIVLLCDAADRWSAAALRAGVRGVLPRDAT